MALVLTFPSQDNDFFIDDARFVISSITVNSFTITRKSDEVIFNVKENLPAQEIHPGVSINFGLRAQNNLARVAFTAPNSIKIDRGDLYRKQNGHTRK